MHHTEPTNDRDKEDKHYKKTCTESNTNGEEKTGVACDLHQIINFTGESGRIIFYE